MAGHSQFFTTDTSQAHLDDLVLELLPLQGRWAVEQYLWLTDNANRHVEFHDGFIEVLPMPTDKHQTILLFLYDLFRAFLNPRGGKVLVAPLRLRLQSRLYREPDLLLLCNARDERRQERYWLGADLVLEVVSPDKPERDLVHKRSEYGAAGIPEYWIVNPETETITVLVLDGNVYVEHGLYPRGAVATSALLSGFGVEVAASFDAD